MSKKLAAIAVTGVLALGVYAGLSNATVALKVGSFLLHNGAALEAKVFGYDKKQVEADGINYTLLEGGSKDRPTIVMLHGYSADKTVFQRYGRYFLEDYHVVIPDMAGHGETGFDPGWKYDIPTQSARIVALMDAMGIDKFHVVGNSMGGFITATIAANYPDRVLSAVPIDPAGVISPERSDMEKMFLEGRNPFLFSDRAGFDQMYSMTMAVAPVIPDVAMDAMAAEYIQRRPELTVIHEQFSHKDMLDDRLADIKAPFFLIWGAKDQILDVSAVPVWMKGVPQGKSHVFEELGHMPMLEDPEATAKLVIQFYQELKG